MIKRAIVLAAGEGMRLRPLTLAIPKEMIRVGTKPVIEHAINVLKAGGIGEILVVVGRKKEAIMDYLGSGERLGVDISYKIQEELKGTAHAVYQGKDFIGNEDFVVIYGDNYLKPYEVMKEIVKFHEEKRADATLVLHPVKDPRRFGIVKIDANNKVLGIIEKPTLEEAQSYKMENIYLSIAGLLVLKPVVFEYIEKTNLGKHNEIWLTDSIQLMKEDGATIYGFLFKGARYDIGTFGSLKEADKLEQTKGQ
ncbi:MAG: nucleotidyltransferase family protein [Hadesarchaea archaeon]|nr:MAG: nucleotidyltransferase family protein [Hadesarchaea archaeon]